MAKHFLVAVLLIAAVFCHAAASEEEGKDVIKLINDKAKPTEDFETQTASGEVWFIKFFAPWCGHCKRLAPAWGELATAFKDHETIKIAHVDCTTDRDVCTTADIKGYPTLKVFHKGEEVKSYRGARELEALKDFITETANELTTETTE
ncbi:thioredoxin-like protein [Scenedesmus sp. NREL 46B-D3]|nr:thioredoxin-like protein [Scenedesmus sp. NREL 46B-D3]